MVKLRMIGDRVAVKVRKTDQVSSGGIHLVKEEETQQGDVVAVGPGLVDGKGELRETVVKEGDTVLVNPKVGMEVEVEGEKLRVYPESEIVAIVRDVH